MEVLLNSFNDQINKKTPEFQSGVLSVISNKTQRQATEIHLQDQDARDGGFGLIPYIHDEVSVPKAVSLSRMDIVLNPSTSLSQVYSEHERSGN